MRLGVAASLVLATLFIALRLPIAHLFTSDPRVVAALDPFFPVWAIASQDGTLSTVQEAAGRIQAMGATLVSSGTAADAVTASAYKLPVPVTSPTLLSPLLSVVPGQLFALALSRARGLDADAPYGLKKVTLAA